MATTPVRHSPIHAWLVAHEAKLKPADGQPTAARVELRDLSDLLKWGLKGSAAVDWLRSAGVEVPADMFATGPLAGDGLIARLGKQELLLEDGPTGKLVHDLSVKLGAGAEGVYRIERQEATFLLGGPAALEVLAQTCGINFREQPLSQAIFTRVAGVSCMILPQPIEQATAYRIWVDPSFAIDLWETLAEIGAELGGQVVSPAAGR